MLLFSFFILSKCGGNNLGSHTHIVFFLNDINQTPEMLSVGLNNNDISIDRAV